MYGVSRVGALVLIFLVFIDVVCAWSIADWKPQKLLEASGAAWPYQKSPEMLKELREHIPAHFAQWKRGATDKQVHPLFVSCSGPGTGTSRLLQEFLPLIKEAISTGDVRLADDVKAGLQQRLDTAYVFNVSFESTTPYDPMKPATSSGHELGTRMLWQLVDRNGMTYSEFAKSNSATPDDVIQYLARLTRKTRRELTVVLAVDGLHKLLRDDNNLTFTSVLTMIISLVNGAPEFVIACVAAAILAPILRASAGQLKILLLPPSLDGSQIIRSTDPLIHLLVSDMGGHGRALEALQECVRLSIFNSVRVCVLCCVCCALTYRPPN
jgi:hypothetical protein